MADRKDYYYKQKVTEAELDSGFSALEDADRAIITDLGLVGIALGSCNQRGAGANVSIDVNTHLGYDDAGQRIYVPSVVNVPVATDYLAASTDVSVSGRSKILSVFLVFQRNLSDPRLDGNSISVFFDRAESYAIVVKQGAEALSPTAPPLEAGKLLICDITRTFGQTQILNSNISFARRQDMFRLTGAGPVTLTGKTAKELAQLLQDALNTHISGTSGVHAATAIGYAGGPAWRDGTTNPAATVEAQLDKILTDLGDASVNGTARISSLAASGVNVSLASGSARSQFLSLLSQLDTLWSSLVSVVFGLSGADFVSAVALNHLPQGTVRLQLAALDNRSFADRLVPVRNWPERASVTVTASISALCPIAWDHLGAIRGGAFVCVTGGATLCSQDGVEWSAASGAGSHPWAGLPKAVASGLAQTGAYFLTGDSSSGGTYYTNNGVSWTAGGSSSDPTSSILHVPWLGIGWGLWILGGASGKINTCDGSLVFSAWTNQTVPVGFAGKEIIGLAASSSIIVAITSASHNKVMTSVDGVNWVERTTGTTQHWYAIAFDDTDGMFIAIGDTAAYKSPDGITWTAITRPSALSGGPLVSDGQGLWVTTFNTSGPYVCGIQYSYDKGATWVQVIVGDHAVVTDGYKHLIYGQNRFVVARSNSGKIDFALSLRR